MLRRRRVSISMMLLVAMGVLVVVPRGYADPMWIWTAAKGEAKPNEVAYFRKGFELDERPGAASVYGSCDNEMVIWINGKRVGHSTEWQRPVRIDVKEHLKKGRNIIAVKGVNDGGNMAGLVLRLEMKGEGDWSEVIETDASWRVSATGPDAWQTAGLDDSKWASAVEQGKLGDAPWGNLGEGGSGSGGSPATAPEQIAVPAGFEVQLVHVVPKAEQGSWVALSKGPEGRLFAADQGGAGLYQISVAENGEELTAEVERIDVPVSGAQGLVWAFDSLYAHVSGKGLYRITDSDGDGALEEAKFLGGPSGGGEHGNHAVIVTEDGEGLYVVSGNHTNLPEGVTKSRLSMDWNEDLLLPRQWDARGHARGRLAPGGWICRIDPDAREWEVISVGYRNQYDVAINRHGEMFTFDADMEWDMGMPWYRPTRICQVTSGSEFGWRSGSGKWPVYYEDSLPPALDIGPGSPTGVVFGTGAKFPAKFQEALYALDWTFGTIYAVQLIPDGAGYRGVKEEFLSGSPLPVTDAVIGEDGAFYFLVGGRGTQSALYRVAYTGDESVARVSGVDNKAAADARALRRSLEQYHGQARAEAIDAAWPHLGSEDRFLRYAARLAVEAQPVDRWKRRALEETRPLARSVAAIALARTGAPELREEILESLLGLEPASLSETEQLALLRAYALTFIRMGTPSPQNRERIIEAVRGLVPSERENVNVESVRVLVYLDAPGVVDLGMSLMMQDRPDDVPGWGRLIQRNAGYGGTIQKMLDNPPPTQGLEYAFMLRNVRYGWSLEQRRAYFEFINAAARHTGGASYPGFLENIRKDALENSSEAERVAVADLTGESLEPLPPFEIQFPQGPGREWTVAGALAAVEGNLEGRDFASGRNFYHALACASCHRFDGWGGAVGPDLSTVKNKFSLQDLLEATIEPSKVISDQYGSSEVVLHDGRSFTGRLIMKNAEDGKEAEIYLPDPESPPMVVKMSEVKSMRESPVSQMPEGLVSVLNADELSDLVAYLMSRGNPDDPMFKKKEVEAGP